MAEPLAAVDVVPVNVTGAEVRKMAELRWKRFLHFQGVVGVGRCDRVLDAVGVEPPEFQRMVHPTLEKNPPLNAGSINAPCFPPKNKFTPYDMSIFRTRYSILSPIPANKTRLVEITEFQHLN